MILHRDDPAREALEKLGEPMYLVDVNPTAENIARLIFENAKRQGLPIAEVRLWETPHCFATYQGYAVHSRPRMKPTRKRVGLARLIAALPAALGAYQ